MPLTREGFALKRFSEITQELEPQMIEQFGTEVDLSASSFLGVTKDIFSYVESDIWELLEGCYDSLSIVNAEDYLLDNLALLAGFLRYPATYTRGVVYVTGVDGTKIPEGALFNSVRDDQFETLAEGFISSTNCVSFKLTVRRVENSTEYAIYVDDYIVSVTSDPSATKESILAQISEGLENNGDIEVTGFFDEDVPYILVEKVNRGQPFSISASTTLGIEDVTTPFIIRALKTGAIPAKKNTIVSVDTDTVFIETVIVNNSVPEHRECTIKISQPAQALTEYTITIGSTVATYTSDDSPSESEILDSIHQQLSEAGYQVLKQYDFISPTDYRLFVDNIPPDENIFNTSGNFTLTVELKPPEVVFIEEVVERTAPQLAKDITSITNLDDFIIGADVESDAAFRKRVLDSYTTISGASFDILQQALERLPSVTDVKIQENIEYTTGPTGLPPKSFKVVVLNGSDEDIAEAIWKFKPAGIQPWSDNLNPLTVTQEYTDYNSQIQYVKFSRPETVFLWVDVYYTLYSEEEFTPSGETVIREAVLNYGDRLQIGQDVVPKRFIPSIYRETSGVDDLVVKIGFSTDLNTPPLPASYTESRIPITDDQITNFSFARVSAIKV